MTTRPIHGAARAPLLRFTLLTLVAVAAVALALGARDARADVSPDQMTYGGTASHTRVFFDKGFTANLPGILPNNLDGRLRVRVVLDTKTEARLRPHTQFHADQKSAQRGGNLTVDVKNIPVDANPTDGANAEFAVVTTPALHILADVEPDDGDPFECALPGMSPGQTFQEGTVIPLGSSMIETGDRDAFCGKLDITADELPGLGLPRDFVLFQENLVMPYGGATHLRNQEKLFELRVCKMLSTKIPVLWFLGDHCRIDVVGTADADLLVNGANEGFRSKGALEIRTMTNGVASQTVLPAQDLHFASASPVTTSFAIPCNAVAGSNVGYRLQSSTYKARVNKIELGVALEFYVIGIRVGTLDLGGALGRLDLLEGTTLNVTATSPEVFAHLGSMTANSAPSCTTGTPKLRPTFSGVLPTIHPTETQHWFVGVFNDGDGPTSGQYTVTVTIPAGYTQIQVQVPAAPPVWSCSQGGTGGRTVTCTRHLSIAPNAAGTGFAITAKKAAGSCNTTVTATASASGGGSAAAVTANDGGVMLSCAAAPPGTTLPDPRCVPTATDPCD